ncbi:MAG TPA: LamG-like jellyroll fold domain-containing protein, partial [Verrucomicrobiae bacterium]|nr:LamG-like jellyroll fold domain-containing protein [Verrucomicrobiae bacterium]
DDYQNPPKGIVEHCMEGPYMFKRRGIYYLMYSDNMCQDSTYNVKYSTGTSPTGPFTYDPAKNPILETTDDDTVDGPGHHSMLVDGDRVFIVYHRHDNPHDPDGAHRQTCISELHFNADGSIKKVEPDHLGVGYLAPSTVRDSNLALGKPVTASSYLSPDFRPEYAADENNGTLWKAADKNYPQWLQVDLGKKSPVRRVETEFQYPQVTNRYLIECSNDGRRWQTFADRRQNAQPGIMIDRGDAQARYVKITLLGQNSGRPDQWAALWGFRVYDGIDRPNQAPVVKLGSTLHLNFRYPTVTLEATVHDDGLPNGPLALAWSKVSGPGNVTFTHPERVRTGVAVDRPGKYVLQLTADDGQLKGRGTLEVDFAAPTERILDYSFDEASGAIANDFSGNGQDAVLRDGTTRSLGMHGRAIYLDGVNDYVAVPALGALKCATIAAWINPRVVRPNTGVFCSTGTGRGALRLTVNGNGAVQLAVEGAAPQASEFRFAPDQAGEWRHVAVTYDSEAKTVAFYIDGKLDVQRPLKEAPALQLATPLRLGGANSGAHNFSGEIDDFQLHERVLSARSIARLARRSSFVSVAEARRLKDGQSVALVSKPVTFAAANPLSLERSTDFFYVADRDGRAGLRVEDGKVGPDKVRADACASFTGILRTKATGERYVELTSTPTVGAARPVAAQTIKIANWPTAIGCPVRIEGVVKQIAADGQSLIMSDGSETGEVKVITGDATPRTKLESGNSIAVVGVVSCEDVPRRPVIWTSELTRLSPPATDVLAVYSFEGTGETAQDSSPNHQDARLLGGATRTAGKAGQALQLDGEHGYLQLPDLGQQTAVTVALWVNLADYAKDTFASVLHCDGWNWGDFHWNVAADNHKLNAYLNGIGELHSQFQFTPDKLGQWVHVALTYDARARSLRLYVNGVEEAASGIEAPRAVNLSHVKVGCWEGHARFWKGALDEIHFYNRALTAAEIRSLAAAAPANP